MKNFGRFLMVACVLFLLLPNEADAKKWYKIKRVSVPKLLPSPIPTPRPIRKAGEVLKKAKDDFVDEVKRTPENVKKAAKSTGEAVGSVAKNGLDKAKDLPETVMDLPKETIDKVEGGIEITKRAGKSLGHGTDNLLSETGKFLKNPNGTLKRIKIKDFEEFHRNALKEWGHINAEVIGEAGAKAFVLLRDEMIKMNKGKPAVSLSEEYQRALSPFFDAALLKKVEVVWNAKMLESSDNSYVKNAFTESYTADDSAGQAFEYRVYMSGNKPKTIVPNEMDEDDESTFSTLIHELVHVKQFAGFGNIEKFGYEYAKELAIAKFDYMGNKLEKEAYLLEESYFEQYKKSAAR